MRWLPVERKCRRGKVRITVFLVSYHGLYYEVSDEPTDQSKAPLLYVGIRTNLLNGEW